MIFRELFTLYGARTGSTPGTLPELPVQYADCAAWQHARLASGKLQDTVDYWRDRLAGAPARLELPTDRPRPPTQSYRGAVEHCHLDRELLGDVHALARESGATLFMVLLAAWIVVLSRRSGTEDLTIGTPVAGRPALEMEPLIGFFANTLVLRVSTAGSPSFRELTDRLRTVTMDGFAHEEMPFEQLVEVLQPERSLSHSPLFQHMFILQNTPTEGFALPGLSTGALTEDCPDGLRAGLEYATDLYDRDTAERLLDEWRTVLRAAVAAPDTPVDRLPLLSPARCADEGWDRGPWSGCTSSALRSW
ncbi:condensation domain-containing protein [Kitasatospora sp. NPDC092286]|uniref:condensation domain-containing protein n=1 Tax=Kitasatospora sp. NPDC092286 TaxID=3364087 RepID=UPI003823AB37